MSIADKLASALGRKDEAPNIALAERISKAGDRKAMGELIQLLDSKTSAIRSDAIKVIYEAGERNPSLIVPHADKLLSLLDHKDNRIRWGAMSALAAISISDPEKLVHHLPAILDAMDTGSVITRDKGIIIISRVAGMKKYHNDGVELLLEQIEKAPVNQVPMYAERTFEVISKPFIRKFESILRSRKDVLAIPSKQKRIEKLLRQIDKGGS